MASKKIIHQELFEKCMEAAEHGGLFGIADLAAAVDVSDQTLYNHFPTGSKERQMIDEALGKMKRRTISNIRAKLYKSDSPVAQIALYKMLCSPEERAALDYKKVEMNANVQESRRIDMDEAKKFIDALEEKYGEKADDDD